MLTQFANETAFIVGIVTAIGLIIQRKTIAFVIEGTIKVIIGYIILQFGAQLAVLQLSELTTLVERTFNVNGIMPNTEMIAGISQWFYGKSIGFIMLFGMIFHIFIARYTPFKYIFLTGHHILYMASLLAGIMAGTKISFPFQMLIGSIVLACSMTFFPAICQPVMNRIMPDQNVAIGNFGSVGYVLAGFIGAKIGNKRVENSEPKQMTTGLRMLNNPNVIITIFMLALFLFAALFSSKQAFVEQTGNQNIILYVLLQAFQFTAGIYIIIVGVRMMLTEVLTSFKGIADKLVPNAVPALDCPVIFPYAPAAVIVGFTSSLFGGLLGMFVLFTLKLQVVLPAIIAHFLSGGASGVFGYVMGGHRGAFFGAFAHGLLITFLPLLLLPVMHQLGYMQTTFGESDFGVVGYILYNILKLLGIL